MRPSEATTQTYHPEPTKAMLWIANAEHEAMRPTIHRATGEELGGVPFSRIDDRVTALPYEVLPMIGSGGRYTTTAREDLEKCGLIKQVPSAQQLYLAQWPFVPP